jgi:hypothetical protein
MAQLCLAWTWFCVSDHSQKEIITLPAYPTRAVRSHLAIKKRIAASQRLSGFCNGVSGVRGVSRYLGHASNRHGQDSNGAGFNAEHH